MTAASGGAKVSLPADNQILITREFAAPRSLVYRAWTEPELVRRWWPARRGEMTVAEIDLRVGGRWRYAMVTPGGQEVAFNGEYREILAPERLVWTESYEAMPGEAALATLTLSDSGGVTSIVLLVQHETRRARDLHVASGMEDGLQDALEDLERVAVSLGG
ncbi:MAG: SRPBCC family protein [Solirubrobacteraceae bacterium]